MLRTGFSPPAAAAEGRLPSTVAAAEAVLEQWFARPVVLMSSGRAALLLAFRHAGLDRYASRIAMSPCTAQCVFDAVTRAAFPVDPATDKAPVQLTLLIHQYGYRQLSAPAAPVIEDICHSFFASPTSGDRRWAGSLAAFSLPKFLGMSGMVGGLVVESCDLADELRAQRDSAPVLPPDTAERDRQAWLAGKQETMEEIYLRALLHPACSLQSLNGLPTEVSALRAIGEQRAAVARRLIDAIPDALLNDDWRRLCRHSLPYALPVFIGDREPSRAVASLEELGLETGVYCVDRHRNMIAPSWARAILLPCHHTVDEISLDAMTAVLSEFDKTNSSLQKVQ